MIAKETFLEIKTNAHINRRQTRLLVRQGINLEVPVAL